MEGRTLQNHVLTDVFSKSLMDFSRTTVNMIRDPRVIQAAMEAYQTARAGPLAFTFYYIAAMPVIDLLSK